MDLFNIKFTTSLNKSLIWTFPLRVTISVLAYCQSRAWSIKLFARKINDFKNEYSTKFEVFKPCKEAKVNVGVLSAPIQAGALGGLQAVQKKVVLEAALECTARQREKIRNEVR